MQNLKQNIFTMIAGLCFILLAAASAKINKIHCGAFDYYSGDEKEGDGRSYVELKDGRKVYGDRIVWQSGLILKDQIKIDDEKFKIKETRGFYSKGSYYGSLGSSYAKRIIHGKLNVYYTEGSVESTYTNPTTGMTRTTSRPSCTHYIQVGDDGELYTIANQKDIIKYVRDCPKSLAMIDKKDSEIRKSIRKNSHYLNEIIEIYNDGCH